MIWPASNVQNQLIIDRFYSFYEYHREAGFHFPGETHNFWECVYVLNGSIVASGDERIYTLEKGEIIFHKPMELHKYFVENPSGADLLIFSFSLDGPIADLFRNKVFSLSASQQALLDSLMTYVRSTSRGSFSELTSRKDSKSENFMPEHQYLLPFAKVPTYSQMVTTYVYQLLLSLVGDGNVASVSTDPDALTFRKAVNYMNSCMSSQPSISEIAAFCSVSEATLKRLFSKYAGIGIHKYFLTMKMQLATELLKCRNSVTETAEKLGFSSQAYFSATYKREMGINPSEIIRQ